MLKTLLLHILFWGAILPVYAEHRTIFMDELLDETKEIAEVVILDYTLTQDTLYNTEPLQIHKGVKAFRYYYVHQPDSIRIYNAPKMCKYGWQFYNHQDSIHTKRTPHQGFWPRAKDSVLIFFDHNGTILLFGRKTELDFFQLWSPYKNSSWITIFYASSPFQLDNSAHFNAPFLKNLHVRAAEKGYEFASVFYLSIAIDKLENLKAIRRKL